MDIDTLLSKRVRELRKARRITMDQLAEMSGVSRSMISLIERQETSPTAAVLNKLAGALGITLPALFSDNAETETENSPISRFSEQQVWKDPASGYLRRQLSPSGYGSPIDLVEVCFPPGETVVFENAPRNPVSHQLIWMLEGEMKITVGDQSWHLKTGDCLATELKYQIVFNNPNRTPARYALAITTPSPAARNTQ